MQTITLGDDQPTVSILRGHHSLEVFDKACEAEGWSTAEWDKELVVHEYWIAKSDGSWHKSTSGAPGAEPVTVGYW